MITVTACGSALEPNEVLAANDAVRGVGGTTTTTPGAVVTDPGSPLTPGATGGPKAGGGKKGGGATGAGTGSSAGGGSTGGGSTGGGATTGSGVKAASCNGFQNGPGITDSTIRLGNASDISGPLPGVFEGAQQAVKAYVAYFNATNPNGICGRKLALDMYDTRTDNGGNQAAAAKMCETDFADIGSMSIFDSGLAATAQQCGLPTLHSAAVTATFNSCSTCFGVNASGDGEFPNEVYDFWVRNNKDATQHAAFLYLNQGAAAENARVQQAVGAKRGIKWEYIAAIDVAEFNYGPYIQQLKDKGIKMVQFIGGWAHSVRFLQAQQAANYKPAVNLFDPSVYEPGFLSQGGAVTEGVFMFMQTAAIEDRLPEMLLYRQWLGQVAPGATPAFFGILAWSAAKLFVEKSLALGGNLSRANLVKAFKTADGWTGGGLHGPMSVGSKHSPSCIRYATVKDGRWVPYGGAKYRCGGYSKGS